MTSEAIALSNTMPFFVFSYFLCKYQCRMLHFSKGSIMRIDITSACQVMIVSKFNYFFKMRENSILSHVWEFEAYKCYETFLESWIFWLKWGATMCIQGSVPIIWIFARFVQIFSIILQKEPKMTRPTNILSGIKLTRVEDNLGHLETQLEL